MEGVKVWLGILIGIIMCLSSVQGRFRVPPQQYFDGWSHLTLYEHENHKGKKYHEEVGPRCYNVPTFFDDQASSLSTHHRCVKVCKERDCRRCIKMGPGMPGHFRLEDIRMNDAISSFTQC